MSKTGANNKKDLISGLMRGMGIAYFIFLAWAILWKFGRPYIGDGSQRIINLVLFNRNTIWEMRFNVIVFIPFGFYLSAIKQKISYLKQVLLIFLSSATFEVLQYVLAIGRSDITDILLNTIGGTIGIVLFYLLSRFFEKEERTITLTIFLFMTLIELYLAASFIMFGELNIGQLTIRL